MRHSSLSRILRVFRCLGSGNESDMMLLAIGLSMDGMQMIFFYRTSGGATEREHIF